MRRMACLFILVSVSGLAGCQGQRGTTIGKSDGATVTETAGANTTGLKELTTLTTPKSIADPDVLTRAFPELKSAGPIKMTSVPEDIAKAKDAVLGELVNHEVYVRTYSLDADGKISFLAANVAGKGKRVVVQQDYLNYKIVQIDGHDKKVGITLRVQAELVTKNAEVNLNGLFAIGLAVRAGSAAGTLRICAFGLTGEPVSSLIPMPSEITESSLQNAMQAVASLKAKIYDPKVSVLPQIIPD
jgi:hypothetical protein